MQLIRSWPGPEHSQNLPTPVPVVGFLLSALIPPERPKLALCVDSGCPSPPSVLTRGLQTQKKKNTQWHSIYLYFPFIWKGGRGPGPFVLTVSLQSGPVCLFILPAATSFLFLSAWSIRLHALPTCLSESHMGPSTEECWYLDRIRTVLVSSALSCCCFHLYHMESEKLKYFPTKSV